MKYVIYTDGACKGNPGPGGWGVLMRFKEQEKQISGSVKDTTNNKMELMAPIMALRKVKKNTKIIIYTDSTYLKNGITVWIKNWEKNGWKSKNKKPVKNKDLWVTLSKLSKEQVIDWRWVKAHTGNKYNEIADNLATEAIKN